MEEGVVTINQPPYGEDLRKLGAIASLLKVSAQDSPNMTVRVNQGGFWKNETSWVETPALNTSTLSAPSSNKRYTLVCLRENGTLALVNGVSAASPSLPTVPAGYCPLGAVLITAGATSIKNDMIYDLRPFFRAGSASVTHNDTAGRSTADAHPISAITGLQAALDDKIAVSDLSSSLATKADTTGTSDDAFILRQGYTGTPSGNVILEVERGSATNVGLRWNEADLTWEYTNDGAAWLAFSTPILLNNSIAYANLDVGLQASIDDIAGKADLVHTHVAADITDLETAVQGFVVEDAINNGETAKAPSQNIMYDALFAKADLAHTHVAANVTDFTAAAKAATVADAINNGTLDVAPSQNAVFDALALKASTSHTHVAADVTDFTAAAKTAAVADAINDGTTDVAPSQNAVFDALTGKQATITGAATSVTTGSLAANKLMVTDNSGKIAVESNVWDYEAAHLQGVTSNIQTQFTGKAAASHTHVAADVTDFNTASVSAVVTQVITNGVTNKAPSEDAVFDALAGKSDTGHAHAASDITSGVLDVARIPTAIPAASIAGGTVDNTEFGYLNGVTSNIQTQFGGKANTSHTHVAADVTDFAVEAVSAVVTQVITNGVTGKAPSEDAVFDALGGKANTSHTHVAADVTDFATASVTAVVTQVITNGVTGKAPSEDAVFDALAGKSNTGHTHVAADVTDFTSAAKTAAVADAINNGTTDVAPSQNAVYDALVLKQDASGASLNLIGQGSAPATPAAGTYVLYVLSGDGKLYIKDDTGAATVVGTQV